jgi:predicted nuclease of predicted toxin-antitoxin system
MNFLVDVNLPKKFSYFNGANFQFVCDINVSLTDKEIWEHAIKNNQIIITKDVDFYHRFLIASTYPKVIYIVFGNCSLKELHAYFQKNWTSIENLIKDADFIFAYETHIQTSKK